MDNQHKLIKGYRDLTQEEIDVMNAIKSKGEDLLMLTEMVKATKGIDPRWAAIGTTHLQEGLMALVRAVARPTSF
jgi:hypothetical protein